MELNEVYENLMNDRTAYWNPKTREVIFYDPDWDEEPYRSERGVDYPTFCITKVWPKVSESYDNIWAFTDGDDDILRAKAVMRIVNEGWISVDDPMTSVMLREMCNLEREFFIIERRDGRKWVHYKGFTYFVEGKFRSTDMTFCYVGVRELMEDINNLWNEAEKVTRYMCEYRHSTARGVVDNYYGYTSYGDAVKGKYLPLTKVTEDTPCGRYWCYTEDVR